MFQITQVLLPIFLVTANTFATERSRPKTLVSCISPLQKDTRLEVYIEPPLPASSSIGWITVIEVTNYEDVFVEEKDIATIYDQQGDLYKGNRLQFRLSLLNNGLLYGKLTDAEKKLPEIFHCQKLR
jgi:hypothetical protein